MSKRLGKLGKLSDFGQVQEPEPEPQDRSSEVAVPQTVVVRETDKPLQPKQDKLTTINIKILQSQQDWLSDTARLVRGNNDAPVPPSDRVYPQHLIQAAIDYLQAAEVSWEEVKSVEELRAYLNL